MLARWQTLSGAERIFWGFAALCLSLIGVGIVSELYWLGLLPFGLFGLYLAVTNFRWLFDLLLVCIPLSVEFYFGSLGTDLPTEPLMIGLTGIFGIHFLRHGATYDRRYFTHPLALLLYLHLGWIFLSTLFSEGWLVSLKFSLAKGWYVGAFFLLAERFTRTPADLDRIFRLLFWPLVFVAAQSLVRHAAIGFDFVDQFKTIRPFMRNHVSYAGMLVTIIPWLGYLYWRWRPGGTKKMFAAGLALFWLIAIYFSYTRAAYVAMVLIVAAALVIRWRLLRPLILVSLVGAIGVSVYLVRANNYLEYAPDYETTIAHEDLNDLLAATTQFEDVSTMERAYRWVAGGRMLPYHPWLGWGPGNFVEFYKSYTVSSFTTYVSDNPENSGIHSYYLMTLVEQGYPGLLILLAFLLGILIYGEKIYHRLNDPDRKAAVLAALLSLVVIYAFLLINDMLETDKMGSFFFLNVAVIVNASLAAPAADQRPE